MTGLTSVSNVENITLDNDTTVASGVLSGQTISLAGSTALRLNGAGTTAVTIDASHFTTTGTNTMELVGSDDNDTITGSELADAITGGSGSDVIAAGDGADTITLTATSGGTIDGGDGTDTMHIQGNVTGLTSVSNVENITLDNDTTVASGVLSGQTISLAGSTALTLNGAGTTAVTIDASHFTTTGTNTMELSVPMITTPLPVASLPMPSQLAVAAMSSPPVTGQTPSP